MARKQLSRRIRILLILSALLCLSGCSAGGASADFDGQSTPDGRTYYLNGREGYVTVYRAPEEAQIVAYLLNENTAVIDATWASVGGESWGRLHFTAQEGGFLPDSNGAESGWVEMSQLRRRYDKDSFVAEHLDEFVMDSVTLDMRDYETVYLWEYPGSGGRPALATWYTRTELDNVLEFPAYWVDPAGRRWGGYSFFEADGFLCLDEPGLEENILPGVSVAGAVIPAADSAALPRVLPEAEKPFPVVPVLAAAGGAVVLGLAGIGIRRRKKRENKHAKGNI